jgi:signal transduction histidine kinase
VKVGERTVGLINLGELRQETRTSFSAGQIEIASIIANQVAFVIDHMQQIAMAERRTQKHASALQAVCGASRAVTASLSLQETLTHISEQAWRLANQDWRNTAKEKKVAFAAIWLVEDTQARLFEAYPREAYPIKASEGLIPLLFDKKIDVKAINRRIGIIGRTIKTNQPQRVGNVEEDLDYLKALPKTCSELAVPISFRDEVIGVINVEHPNYNAFDEEDERTLQALAAQAAVAIQNARSFESLRKIKGYIGRHTAIEWMKMVSSAWEHKVRGEVGNARGLVAIIRNKAHEKEVQWLESDLVSLENTLEDIAESATVEPLSDDDVIDSLKINEFVKTYLDRRWENRRLPVRFHKNLYNNLDQEVTVRASRRWMRQALDVLIDNAVHAMLGSDDQEKTLTVTTWFESKTVKISIADTGPGIAKEIEEQIFKKPIDKPLGSKGAGVGLLVASTIVQTYGGFISRDSLVNKGTRMIVTLPIEDRGTMDHIVHNVDSTKSTTNPDQPSSDLKVA